MDFNKSLEKMNDFYKLKPNSPFYLKEFGFLDNPFADSVPKGEGYWQFINKSFEWDDGGVRTDLQHMGWCEAPFMPAYPEKVLRVENGLEYIQDFSGRTLKVFKDRRYGFMPEFVDHPVKDMKTWKEGVEWRLNFDVPQRLESIKKHTEKVKTAMARGSSVVMNMVGGYMYLRSLIGPIEMMYKFYDEPELMHACMQKWLEIANKVSETFQNNGVVIDELYFAEDICYNVAPLISYDMMSEFLFPYYQQLIKNVKSRQQHKSLRIHVDTDGYAPSVIDIYREKIGMNYMDPFEVASGCNVVEVAKKYPDLLMLGGIDKRIFTTTPDEVNRYLDGILPFMYKRGGYIPTCDHAVPKESKFECYSVFRKRVAEMGK